MTKKADAKKQTTIRMSVATRAKLDELTTHHGTQTEVIAVAVDRLYREEVIQMASTWVFGCKLGLAQDTCGKRQRDPNSRGAGQWGGCASCVHRTAGNAQTERAESEHASAQQQK